MGPFKKKIDSDVRYPEIVKKWASISRKSLKMGTFSVKVTIRFRSSHPNQVWVPSPGHYT